MKDEMILIALELDDKTLLNICMVSKKFHNFIWQNQSFWRLKLIRLGMKDVTVENIPDPIEAYRQIRNDRDLVYASTNGEIYSVKYLMERGIDKDKMQDALGYASGKGDLNIVKYLLSHGIDLNENYGDALSEASGKGELNMVKFLLDKGDDIHSNDELSLRMASKYGRLDVVQFLVKLNADIHARNNNALFSAERNRHYNVVEYLKNI